MLNSGSITNGILLRIAPVSFGYAVNALIDRASSWHVAWLHGITNDMISWWCRTCTQIPTTDAHFTNMCNLKTVFNLFSPNLPKFRPSFPRGIFLSSSIPWHSVYDDRLHGCMVSWYHGDVVLHADCHSWISLRVPCQHANRVYLAETGITWSSKSGILVIIKIPLSTVSL